MIDIENLSRTGKILLSLAWVLISIQCLLGILIAWSVGFQSYEYNLEVYGSFSSNYFDIMLAVLPFLMVALVSLSVIPLCKAIYIQKSIIKKLLFLLGVLLISLINFETLAFAFERQFHKTFYQTVKFEKELIINSNKIFANNELIINSENLSNEKVLAIQATLISLEKEKINLQLAIINTYKDNQIYRLAQSFYGLNNGEIVSKRQLQLLAKTWFGTLAGIIVLVPILLSFGAFQFRKKEYKEIL
jgi:hypothetical protein|tara:strand:- start:72 stop:809 length:738 start_codon:yes stop_codon:yes gene_type:complete